MFSANYDDALTQIYSRVYLESFWNYCPCKFKCTYFFIYGVKNQSGKERKKERKDRTNIRSS